MKKNSKLSSPATKTILFSVTGMSPAVLTETIWALAHAKPAVIPDRVVVLTTTMGAKRIRQELFEPSPAFGGKCVWDCLRLALDKDFELGDKLRFGQTADDIRVFTSRDPKSGRSADLEDIRSPSDNAAIADFIIEHLRSFTENPQTRIVASIAGGRKTMGALLYACMTLIGRESDRLTHVLVNEPFEDPKLLPKFYFPGQPARELQSGPEKIRTSRAVVELADIPFVPLRNRFHELAELPGNFNFLVNKYSRTLKQDSSRKAVVQIDAVKRRIIVDGISVCPRTRSFQTLKYLIHCNKNGAVPSGQIEAIEPMKAYIGAESNWMQSPDDLKRELSEIRKQFNKAGILWTPGDRRESLILPPFVLKT